MEKSSLRRKKYTNGKRQKYLQLYLLEPNYHLCFINEKVSYGLINDKITNLQLV